MFLGTADFYALNHYSSRLVTFGSDPNPNFNPDASYVTSVDEAWLKPNETPYIIVINKSNLCYVYYSNHNISASTRRFKKTFDMVKKRIWQSPIAYYRKWIWRRRSIG